MTWSVDAIYSKCVTSTSSSYQGFYGLALSCADENDDDYVDKRLSREVNVVLLAPTLVPDVIL